MPGAVGGNFSGFLLALVRHGHRDLAGLLKSKCTVSRIQVARRPQVFRLSIKRFRHQLLGRQPGARQYALYVAVAVLDRYFSKAGAALVQSSNTSVGCISSWTDVDLFVLILTILSTNKLKSINFCFCTDADVFMFLC